MAERLEDLRVWQAAASLKNDIYSATRGDRFSRDFGLRDQIQRVPVSIMSNIAEGFENRMNRQFTQYLGQAKASAGEVRRQLYVAKDQVYLTAPDFEEMSDLADHITRQLYPLIQHLVRSTPNSRISELPFDYLTISARARRGTCHVQRRR